VSLMDFSHATKIIRNRRASSRIFGSRPIHLD
jgi:hypothetical protein